MVRRIKVEDEEVERQVGLWTQRKRSSRSDKYKLPGFNAFCHDEDFFRFDSGRSQPLREHIGVGEYKVCALSCHSHLISSSSDRLWARIEISFRSNLELA